MAHVAFVVPPFLGHLNPSVAFARALERRGHTTTFLHMADAEPLLATRRVAFRSVGQGTHPTGALAPILRRMASVNGPLGLGGIIRDVARVTDMLCRDLPEALRGIGADFLVCDQAEAAGGLVAGHLGLPYLSLANALPLNRERSVPPPFIGWRYDPTPWGIERNKGGYRVSDWLMRPHARVIASWAERWRLGRRETMADCLSPLAEISQTVAGFDMPRQELPETFHHCGPLRDREALTTGFRMPARNGRRLAYGSLGTLQGGRLNLFRRMAEAARRLDLQLVATHAGALTPDQVRSFPGSPDVFDFVPQNVVLSEASVAILHGGLNTVLDALAAGVPIAAMPIAFEQGAIGARLERAGAGLIVPSGLFGSTGALARAIGRLLTEPAFREAAGRLGAEIAAAGGVERAADIVEQVLATGRPVRRSDLARLERAA